MQTHQSIKRKNVKRLKTNYKLYSNYNKVKSWDFSHIKKCIKYNMFYFKTAYF